jgi:hypothetical protein
MFGFKPSSKIQSERFPVGCVVELPAINPFYGSKQTCDCESHGIFHGDHWACGV